MGPVSSHWARAVVRVPTLLILGPLQLHGAAGEIGLGGVKPRRLLAALAVYTGEVLSADRLADVVWEDSPPRSARQNLQTYVWSLRRSLAAAAGSRTHPHASGGRAGAIDYDGGCPPAQPAVHAQPAPPDRPRPRGASS